MERGELPSRTMVARLLGRTLSLALAVFAMTGAGTFFVEYFQRHDDSSELFPFSGWQVDLAAIAIALTGFALFVAGSVGMRRYRPASETPRSYQVIAAFIAIVLGVSVSQAFHHQPERAYDWAASHTGSAHRFESSFARQTLADLGDATHPPAMRNPGSRASSQQAAPLMTPGDLGPQWRYGGVPEDTVGTPTAPGLKLTARTFLTAEHWNGTLWTHDQDVIESATRYATAADAGRAIYSYLHATEACSFPGSCTPGQIFTRSRIAGLTVWQETESGTHTFNAFISDGTLTAHLFCDAMPNAEFRMSEPRILDAAVHRIEKAGRSAQR
jgi:hypothetical protein